MIPVPEKAIKQLDFRDYRNLYSMLLVKQYNYINIPENKKRIKEKAKKLYNIINSDKENKTTYFYKKLCYFNKVNYLLFYFAPFSFSI